MLHALYVLCYYYCSYYGADDSCSGDAYEYLVATDQCSNYPDFFGRVECKSNGTLYCFDISLVASY